MSEAYPGDAVHASEAAEGPERDAKIEQLLLVGLDHYFGGRYDQAINVWTRALFLDRSHPRARAYIERARTALAEAQRESEELLQSGVDAFHRGERDEARRLLLAALDRGAPSDEALAVLGHLNRLEAAVPAVAAPTRSSRTPVYGAAATTRGLSARLLVWIGAAVVVAAAAGYTMISTGLDWQWLLLSDEAPAASAPVPVRSDTMLPLPRRGEMALTRAKSLAAAGRLRDALVALDGVRATDPERAEADRLRSDIQHQLLALTNLPPSGRERSGTP